MKAQQAFSGLQKIYSGVTDEEFKNYLKLIHDYEGPL